MIEKLKHIDTDLFLTINSWHNPAFDDLMYWSSHKFFWIWLYLILFAIAVWKFKRKILLIIPVIFFMILVTDQSSNFVKKSVKRYRPCHNLEIQNEVFVNGQCGGQYGFVSSHAANTFALATFLTFLFFKHFKILPFLLFDWALLVAYSRIYNGVHYPADIIGGAIIGVITSLIAKQLYLHFEGLYFPENNTSEYE